MQNRSIPRAEWQIFFEDFNRRHRGRLVNITVVGEKIGAQREVRGLPLNGIVADASGKEIEILLGDAEGSSLDHPVGEPQEVWIEMDDEGLEIALEILSENGQKTILELCPPASSAGTTD